MTRTIFRFVVGLFLLSSNAFAETQPLPISWQGWSSDLFQKASAEKKLVILDLEAVWCHWCHVMDQVTYRNPEVVKILNESFIAVRVDQDSRPDLSLRYQEYGWPATIFFSPEGKELVKRAGYIEPAEMKALLAKLVKDPNTPEKEASSPEALTGESSLPTEIREKLAAKHTASLDLEIGGLKIAQRYLDNDAVEFALRKAAGGSETDGTWVQLTLDNNLKLIDPVWGGAYQYSTHRDWEHPHFEKIMSTQAKNIRLYSLAYSYTGEKEYRDAAEKVAKYLKTFLLSPDGAFYTSQDADYKKGIHSDQYFKKDDKGRRALGVPAIDKHIYARENGWAIAALAELYAATGEKNYLGAARKAAEWVEKNRSLPGGSYRHDEVDSAGPYLGDSLAMGEASLALYAVTGERSYLSRSTAALSFIKTHFIEKKAGVELPGFVAAQQSPGLALPAVRHNDENISMVRLANMAHRYTGNQEFRTLAEHAMKYLSTPAVALNYITNVGVLLADDELRNEPLHITVVGPKDDAVSQSLFLAALKYPSTFKRTEWWDKREGALPNPDVAYPELTKAAAFICTNRRCSLPIYEPNGIGETIEKFLKQAKS